MGYTHRSYWAQLLLFILLVSCESNSASSSYSEKRDLNEFPKLNLSGNKSIDISISECYFLQEKKPTYLVVDSDADHNGVRILLRSMLTCDFDKGATVKEIKNNSDSLLIDIYQKGPRLSNECRCYFYFQISLKDRKQVPGFISVGGIEYKINLSKNLQAKELEQIRKNLK